LEASSYRLKVAGWKVEGFLPATVFVVATVLRGTHSSELYHPD
jgi:hypothetical protein